MNVFELYDNYEFLTLQKITQSLKTKITVCHVGATVTGLVCEIVWRSVTKRMSACHEEIKSSNV